MKSQLKKQWSKGALIAGMLAVFTTFNARAADASKPSLLHNSLAIMLLLIIVCLLLAIGLLAYVLIGAGQVYVQRIKAQQNKKTITEKALVILILCLMSSAAFAADTPTSANANEAVITTIDGLSKIAFYVLVAVIGLELVVIITMLFQLKAFLAKEALAVVAEEVKAKEPFWSKLWVKINSFKPENEVVDTGHNYDGIRELDNGLPAWWLYGFYACIVFSFIYVYRFHVSHSAPSSTQEYEIAMAKADAEKEAYLKRTASKVDENSVMFLTSAAALAEGKKLFAASCSPCHGAEGQGVVGPNLTDEYWLHKGGIKDVFKTIKYGVQEKGMKAWKDDFSPVQLAEIASYIKSIQGTKPAGGKEPQGELFKEDAQADTNATKTADKKLAAN